MKDQKPPIEIPDYGNSSPASSPDVRPGVKSPHSSMPGRSVFLSKPSLPSGCPGYPYSAAGAGLHNPRPASAAPQISHGVLKCEKGHPLHIIDNPAELGLRQPDGQIVWPNPREDFQLGYRKIAACPICHWARFLIPAPRRFRPGCVISAVW